MCIYIYIYIYIHSHPFGGVKEARKRLFSEGEYAGISGVSDVR